MAKLASVWTSLAAVLGFASCDAPEIDAKAKADALRLSLEKTSTLSDFIRVAQSEGLDCKHSTADEANCWWREKSTASATSLVPCAEIFSAIMASGKFVDGKRRGDYDVQDVYTGC
jgi:hypothetical protein